MWLYPQGGGAPSSSASPAESADSQGRGAILLAVQLLLVESMQGAPKQRFSVLFLALF